MITPEAAIESARRWLARRGEPADGELLTWEFELGYIVFRRPEAVPDRAGPPDTIGRRRLIVDKVTGRVYTTGSLSQDLEAEQYTVKHAATSRFPVDVLEVLESAGWWPGSRHLPAVRGEFDKLTERIPELESRLPLFPAAAEALAEFKGLRLRQFAVDRTGPGVQTWPLGQRIVVDPYLAFGAAIGARVFPFGRYEDGPSDIVIDEAGRLYVLHPDADFFLADNVVDALVALVRRSEPRRLEVRPRGAAAVAANPIARTQRSVELSYHAVFPDGATSAPATKMWFVDLPLSLNTAEVWEETMLRIFYDANTNRRRADPLDAIWFDLDECDVAVVDAKQVLAWDATFTEASMAQHLPFLVSQAKVSWEPAACFVIDSSGEYSAVRGEEFAELVVYRGLDDGRIDEAAARVFLEHLFPGQADGLLARWPTALCALTANRPTLQFRKTPVLGPFQAGPVDSADL
jgi:hypothetical protein